MKRWVGRGRALGSWFWRYLGGTPLWQSAECDWDGSEVSMMVQPNFLRQHKEETGIDI
jgi:hypothetical protein